jgi:integrase
MTGTIRARSPGHFELRAYNAATGTQVTKTYAHPRKQKGAGIAEAKKQLARLVSDVAEGKYGAEVDPAEKVTLSALLDEWIAHGETRGRSPNTLHGYRSKAARIKAGPKLSTRHLDRWYDALLAGGMTAATLIHHHRAIRAALNQANRWKYIRENPADDVQLDCGGRPEMHVPTAVQARALILRAGGTFSPDLGPILLFAMLTGMRRGELCGIQWSDIDWEGSRLTVRRSVWQIGSTCNSLWSSRGSKTLRRNDGWGVLIGRVWLWRSPTPL